jgi:nucleoid-associated protein YgaU
MNRFRALFMGFATAAAAGGLAAYNGLFSAANEPVVSEVAKPAETAEKPVEVAKVDPAATAVEPPAEKPAETTAKAPEPAAAPEAKQPAPAVADIAPAFDTLRAEPDGSLLVSGQTQPNSDVELMNGSTVLGKVKAGASGDFAMVLDEPLKPGDYALVLRMTGSDGKVATSLQTATVSIPETKTGQVLALVEEPGKASRIISAPAAGKVAEVATAPAAEPEKPAEVAAADPAAKPAVAETEMKAEVPAAEPVKPAVEEVAVEAVEIEGKKIFIAGQAKAGSTIRLYANGDILGETKATENNRFLLEIERELAVGDYAISAEMLDANGQQVLAKAVVPFKREAGEAVVAVAPEAAKEEPKTEVAVAAPAEQSADAAKATEPASTEVAVAPAESAAQDAATAPALKKVDTSVIIRRGDSLWRISKRIYGRGVRYSTIYLANKESVKNPNRIWPGQVMMIPDKTPEGEAADMAEIEKRKAGETTQQ